MIDRATTIALSTLLKILSVLAELENRLEWHENRRLFKLVRLEGSTPLPRHACCNFARLFEMHLQELLNACCLQAEDASDADKVPTDVTPAIPAPIGSTRQPIPMDIERYVYGGTFESTLSAEVRRFTLTGGKTSDDNVTPSPLLTPSPNGTPLAGIHAAIKVDTRPFYSVFGPAAPQAAVREFSDFSTPIMPPLAFWGPTLHRWRQLCTIFHWQRI
jgi:hypothetical protein